MAMIVRLAGAWAMRECPYGKSSIPRDASACPHCQRVSKPWRFHEGPWWTTDDVGNDYWLDERNRSWQPPRGSSQP